MTVRKGYAEGPFGQVHWRMAAPDRREAPDLYCFHPAPFSGLAFTGVMPHLAKDRRVVAPDYPGYGGSDAGEASIEHYAAAMAAVMDDVSAGAPVDICGFHTGCFVAAQLCLDRPSQIRRAMLIDVPAFNEEKRESFLSKTKPLRLTSELSCLEGPWASGVIKRLESQPMARAFEMFVENLRPGARMNDAFRAAFSYPWAERLARIETPTRILATQSPLLDASRAAAAAMPIASLVERRDIKRAVLDEAAETTATEILRFLDET